MALGVPSVGLPTNFVLPLQMAISGLPPICPSGRLFCGNSHHKKVCRKVYWLLRIFAVPHLYFGLFIWKIPPTGESLPETFRVVPKRQPTALTVKTAEAVAIGRHTAYKTVTVARKRALRPPFFYKAQYAMWQPYRYGGHAHLKHLTRHHG